MVVHVLARAEWAPALARWLPAPAAVVQSLEALGGGDVLIAFNSGVIVPKSVLARYARAYNFHAAPPDYPGRDPHHWAVYDGATQFGVTCHVMTERVDAGPIIASEPFEIGGWPPQQIRRYAEGRLLALFALWAPRLIAGNAAPNRMQWRGSVRRRADLVALLDLRGIERSEAERRMRAFHGFSFTQDQRIK